MQARNARLLPSIMPTALGSWRLSRRVPPSRARMWMSQQVSLRGLPRARLTSLAITVMPLGKCPHSSMLEGDVFYTAVS